MTQFPPHYPVEYIEGRVRFFGRDFAVTPDVLIPRLETEGLVRRARQVLQTKQDNSNISGFGGGNLSKNSSTKNNTQEEFSSRESEQNIAQQSEDGASFSSPDSFCTFATKSTGNGVEKRSTGFLPPQEGQKQSKTIVVDIGCGSGIIGTSIADLADEAIFLDISPEALRVAEENFRTHFPDKKAEFIVSDLLKNCQLPTANCQLLFLTNLPYIRDDDWQHMSADTVHEPKLALFGGEKTGFELYERLFQEFDKLSTILPSNYPTIQLLYEFGFDQRDVAEEVVKKYPQWEYSFFADYAGIERFGEINLHKNTSLHHE